MSGNVIFTQEIDFYLKKGKWKKCICTIQINQRVENTLCAIIKDLESSSTVERIDIYGYECGINNTEFIFIGREDCYSIRFSDLNKMMELGSILKQYINDVSYFMKFEECSKSDCMLIPKNWYRFHVQNNRICLTEDHKGKEIIKIWNFSRIGKTALIDCFLNIEINSGNDCGVYTFYRDTKKVLLDIYSALNYRKDGLKMFPVSKIDQNNLVKRKSEHSNLKRLNSCTNSSTIKPINRTRASSSSETYSSDYNSSLPSTPYGNNSSSPTYLNINEDAEPSLVFQMDSLDCGSTESNVSEVDSRKISNSEGYDSMSTESQSRNYRVVGLERFPFEAENKQKMIDSFSSTLKNSDSITDNIGIVSKPTNGRCYQSIASLKNQHSTSSCVNLDENTHLPETAMNNFNSSEKKDESEDVLFMNYDNEYSSSSFIQTPSPLSCTSIENQSVPVLKSMSHTLSAHHSYVYKESGHSFPIRNYYNLSNHITTPAKDYSSDGHTYYNLSNHIESYPTEFKYSNEEEKELKYATLDFSDYQNPIALKIVPTLEFDSNYKQIDIKNTEALKALDEFSFPKTQKKSLFKSLFNKNK